MSLEVFSPEYVKYKALKGKDGWLYVWDIDGFGARIVERAEFRL